jgi:hypothetical protein
MFGLYMKKNVLKKPRNLELLLYIHRHEGLCASELNDAGFTKPGVYVLLGSLIQAGLIRGEPREVQTPHGMRYRKAYFVTDRGTQAALHLGELEKVVGVLFTNERGKRIEKRK